MKHPLHVALRSGHPLLGLLHDAVEDGYLPRLLLRIWPALDAITRRKSETYAEYIERVAVNPKARKVKICDLKHNLARNGGPKLTLRIRYFAALERLEAKPDEDAELNAIADERAGGPTVAVNLDDL